MPYHLRSLTLQESVTQVACHIHDVARPSISIAAIELVVYLIDGPRDVGTLARATSLEVATVSKRLKDLRDAGLVVCRVEGSRRIYKLCDTIKVISHGEYCLVLFPAEEGLFAIGIAHKLLNLLHSDEHPPQRDRRVHPR